MTSSELQRPFGGAGASRIARYLNERFPVDVVVVQVISYYAAMLFGKAITTDGALAVSAGDVLAVVAIPAFFLLARVFDEHKDFEFDVEHLPDRPLPRGAISWREVNGLGAVAFAVTLAVSVAVDGGIGPVVAWWAIAMAYLVLTRYEFFVRPWLRAHFVTNTVTHLPVYALASVWAAQIGAEPEWVPPEVALVGLLGYCSTFALDFWRKSHAPEDERPAVDSYTQQWGTTPTAIATGVAVVVVVGIAMAMLAAADVGSAIPYAVLALVALPVMPTLVAFARRPSRATNERKKNVLALTLLAVQLTVIVTLLVDRGL